MEQTTYLHEVVGQEIQAYVNSLVSALGGTGADEDGRYVLGDDALACLKDLRRWLKLYDERTNRLDVARCLAEANLVNGDLLQILSLWREEATNDRIMSKVALACLELLVPLTWPLEKTDLQMTVNHHRHLPYLQQAQLSYKRGILNHKSSKILRTVVRVGLPSMASPMGERSGRDEGIIKLILYLIRNVAIIAPSRSVQSDSDDEEISRSSTIDAFHYQDILRLLLTVSSSMGEEFGNEDVVILEVLYHLLKGIDAERLFMSDSQLDAKKADELRDLLNKEAGMLRSYSKYAPTRHNRFGTMIWIKRDDERVSTVSGQDVLRDDRRGLAKIDETKKWKKAKAKARQDDTVQEDVDTATPLNTSARRHLRAFVGEFLDSAFNPLFRHIHKAIEREADRFLDSHWRQFFYLISWFLRAERARQKITTSNPRRSEDRTEADENSFSLVATVLTQELFITLNRFMQESYDNHGWQDLQAGMRCFTQILLTVQEMSESALEEDQIIAENIQSRMFYEETTHERIVSIIRYYSNQGFGYLDACTELAHVHLRMLEHYSKQNVEMQVRSRRRARKKKKAADASEPQHNGEANDPEREVDDGLEREEVASAQGTSSERRFDFNRFAVKFMSQGCVDTFVSLTRYYQDLTPEQLKRAHRFFYRVAFKMERSVMLFRVDIISLFNNIIKGPGCLDPLSAEHKEWSELIRQLFKRLTRTIEQRPQLIVELLFSKINSTVHFLEHGYEMPTASTKPRVPAQLEIKPGLDLDKQIAIAVVALLNQSKKDVIEWIKQVLSAAASERQAWEMERSARQQLERENQEPSEVDQATTSEVPSIFVKPDNEERRVAIFKDNKLRLLMTLVGFQPLGIEDDTNASWIIPSSASSSQLFHALEAVKKSEIEPLILDDGKSAEDFIRRKAATSSRRAEYDDDSEGDGFIDNSDDFQFPAGGPTVRKSDALELLRDKKARKDRGSGESLTEEEREARARARREANLQMQRKIKSELFVHDSDDEDNEDRDKEFFAKEEELRKAQGRRVLDAVLQGIADEDDDGSVGVAVSSRSSKKRKQASVKTRRRKRARTADGSSDAEDATSPTSGNSPPGRSLSEDNEPTDTPLSSPHLQSSQERRSRLAESESSATSTPALLAKIPDRTVVVPVDRDEDEGGDPLVSVGRRRVRGGFVIDSDSE